MLVEVDLVNQALPMLEAVARKMARRLGGHVQVDDLRGIGQLALLEVTRSYDPARSSFAAYVSAKLKWAIFDGLRRETHGRAAARLRAVMASERFGDAFLSAPESDGPTTQEEDQARLGSFREGHAAALALGLYASSGEGEPPGPTESPEEQLAGAQTARAVSRAVKALPERERALVERHYYGGEPFDVIAQDLGISKSWASRLHKEAIEHLQRTLRAER